MYFLAVSGKVTPAVMSGACRCDEERGTDIWYKMKKGFSSIQKTPRQNAFITRAA